MRGLLFGLVTAHRNGYDIDNMSFNKFEMIKLLQDATHRNSHEYLINFHQIGSQWFQMVSIGRLRS